MRRTWALRPFASSLAPSGARRFRLVLAVAALALSRCGSHGESCVGEDVEHAGPMRRLVLPSGALSPLRIDSGIFPSQAVSSSVFLALTRDYLGINGTLARQPSALARSGFSLVAGCGTGQHPSRCCPESALGAGSCAEAPERAAAPAAFVALEAWPDLLPSTVASAWTEPGTGVAHLGLAPYTARYSLYLSLEAADRVSASTSVAGTSWKALADESASQALASVHSMDPVLRDWSRSACRDVRDTATGDGPSLCLDMPHVSALGWSPSTACLESRNASSPHCPVVLASWPALSAPLVQFLSALAPNTTVLWLGDRFVDGAARALELTNGTTALFTQRPSSAIAALSSPRAPTRPWTFDGLPLRWRPVVRLALPSPHASPVPCTSSALSDECFFPVTNPAKVAWRPLASMAPPAYALATAFALPPKAMSGLMRDLALHRANHSDLDYRNATLRAADEAACTWVRANRDVWLPWVRDAFTLCGPEHMAATADTACAADGTLPVSVSWKSPLAGQPQVSAACYRGVQLPAPGATTLRCHHVLPSATVLVLPVCTAVAAVALVALCAAHANGSGSLGTPRGLSSLTLAAAACTAALFFAIHAGGAISTPWCAFSLLLWLLPLRLCIAGCNMHAEAALVTAEAVIRTRRVQSEDAAAVEAASARSAFSSQSKNGQGDGASVGGTTSVSGGESLPAPPQEAAPTGSPAGPASFGGMRELADEESSEEQRSSGRASPDSGPVTGQMDPHAGGTARAVSVPGSTRSHPVGKPFGGGDTVVEEDSDTPARPVWHSRVARGAGEKGEHSSSPVRASALHIQVRSRWNVTQAGTLPPEQLLVASMPAGVVAAIRRSSPDAPGILHADSPTQRRRGAILLLHQLLFLLCVGGIVAAAGGFAVGEEPASVALGGGTLPVSVPMCRWVASPLLLLLTGVDLPLQLFLLLSSNRKLLLAARRAGELRLRAVAAASSRAVWCLAVGATAVLSLAAARAGTLFPPSAFPWSTAILLAATASAVAVAVAAPFAAEAVAGWHPGAASKGVAPAAPAASEPVPADEVRLGPLMATSPHANLYRAEVRGVVVCAKQFQRTGNAADPLFRYLLSVHIGVLSQMRHPRVAHCEGYCFTLPTELVLLTSHFPNGSLRDQLRSGGLDLHRDYLLLLRLAADATEGLAFLHTAQSKPLVHGSLDCGNVLLDADWRAAIADVGSVLVRDMLFGDEDVAGGAYFTVQRRVSNADQPLPAVALGLAAPTRSLAARSGDDVEAGRGMHAPSPLSLSGASPSARYQVAPDVGSGTAGQAPRQPSPPSPRPSLLRRGWLPRWSSRSASAAVKAVEEKEKKKQQFVVSNPAYVSPEVLRGHPHTTASDVYALGCILFEALLEGEPPFAHTNPHAAALSVMRGVSPMQHLPPSGLPLHSIVAASLRSDPRRRPTAAQVLRVLEQEGERRTGDTQWRRQPLQPHSVRSPPSAEGEESAGDSDGGASSHALLGLASHTDGTERRVRTTPVGASNKAPRSGRGIDAEDGPPRRVKSEHTWRSARRHRASSRDSRGSRSSRSSRGSLSAASASASQHSLAEQGAQEAAAPRAVRASSHSYSPPRLRSLGAKAPLAPVTEKTETTGDGESATPAQHGQAAAAASPAPDAATPQTKSSGTPSGSTMGRGSSRLRGNGIGAAAGAAEEHERPASPDGHTSSQLAPLQPAPQAQAGSRYQRNKERTVLSSAASTSQQSHRSVVVQRDELRFDGGEVGAGMFGKVYRAHFRNMVVAVKQVSITDSEKARKAFRRECSIMTKLNHPNIVKVYGTVETAGHMMLIMELVAKGDLYRIIKKAKRVQDNIDHLIFSLAVARDVASGMNHLHTRQPAIMHRDLKSMNVLVSEKWKATITDFGMSRFFEDNTRTLTRCGSPAWAAPEVLRAEKYTVLCDVYSFGIILCELLAWKDPYPRTMTQQELLRGVAYGGLRPRISHRWPADVQTLVKACLADTPSDRPTFETVYSAICELRERAMRKRESRKTDKS